MVHQDLGLLVYISVQLCWRFPKLCWTKPGASWFVMNAIGDDLTKTTIFVTFCTMNNAIQEGLSSYCTDSRAIHSCMLASFAWKYVDELTIFTGKLWDACKDGVITRSPQACHQTLAQSLTIAMPLNLKVRVFKISIWTLTHRILDIVEEPTVHPSVTTW